jgi:NADH:ubiquinone oxidoreductase subunit D
MDTKLPEFTLPNPVRPAFDTTGHDDHVIVNIGPSHPATHGTVQIIAELDGERVVRTDVHCGYLHRGFEKECESHTWHNLIPYVDRLNYVSALINDFAYCEAVETLADLQITPRCRHLRTLLSEYSRIVDHLTCVAAGLMELGAMTAFLYIVMVRDYMYENIADLTGARVTYTYGRIGGLARDLRRDAPYLAYADLDFEVPVGIIGDNYDRYYVRMREMDESVHMIRQLMDTLPAGPISVDDHRFTLPEKHLVYTEIESLINHFKLVMDGPQVPAGEAYAAHESPNGELGFYIVSNGSGIPAKVHVRAPSFVHMGGVHRMLDGYQLADIVPTFGSINMIGGECDR